MSTTTGEAEDFKFLVGGGEMGERIKSFDWPRTPLGPIPAWPQSLKTSISLMLNSQHPMWIGWGKDAVFFYNDAYVHVLSPAKHPRALGRPAAEVWSEIWEICGPLAEKVFQKGEASYVNDVRLFMSRGDFLEETFYSFSYSPIRDESGNVGGLFCPSTEVTPKVLNARRLRTLSELALESLAQNSARQACAAAAKILGRNPDDIPFALVYLTDAEGRTAGLEQRVGIHPGDDLISPAKVDLDGTPAGADVWPIAEVVRTSSAVVTSIRSREGFPPGPARQPVAEALVLPLISRGQERPLGVLVAGVNPTRRLDAEYRTFFELVATHVATAIQNSRATEQEKKRADTLAELDRAKTTFFGNVSHELRTPLTLILGPLEEELRESTVPRERLELAHRNSLRLLKLVNTLLDFSRIEAGRVDASFEPVDLAAFTGELASVFRSLFEKAGLRLILNLDPLPEPVFVDRNMWEKMVFNLLSNAFKFTFEGEVEVRLYAADASFSPVKATGKYEHVCLAVRDTGTGIPAAELPRIFERFHRVRHARSRSHEGTGIGLAFVQELARLHGGRASVESVEGRGTTFTICVPAGRAHLPPERIGSPRSLAPTITGAAPFLEESLRWLPEGPGHDSAGAWPESAGADREISTRALSAWQDGGAEKGLPRILLADDNSDMREYVKRLLSARDYEVIAVENGRQALAVCRANPPALVLSDVMMPELDGFGLLRELRHHPATDSIPVILLSARAGEEARVEGAEAGADDYLTKPFSARELLARVTTHLQLARLRRETETRLRNSQERLQRVLDGSSDGYWEWNAATGEIFMSPRWYELLGYQEGDLERHVRVIPELTHPDDLETLKKNVGAVVTRGGSGDSYEFESRLRAKSGEYKWLFVRGKVMRRDEAGGATLVTGAVTDISARKRVEEELVVSEQRYRNLFESMIEGFCLIEMIFDEQQKPCDLRFIEVNPAFEGQTGLVNATGRRILELVEVYDPFWFDAYGQVALTGKPVRFERLARSVNRWYEVFAAPVGPPELRRVAVVFNDISERKQAEARVEFLGRLTHELSTVSDPDAINRLTTRAIGEFLGVQRCYFFQSTSDPGQVRVLPDWHREGEPALEGVYQVQDFASPELWKQLSQRTVTVDDVRTHPLTLEFLANYQALSIRAYNQSPFIREGRWVACLAVGSDQPRSWTAEEKALLENAVARVWPLIERARSEAALRQSEERFRAVSDNIGQLAWIANARGEMEWYNRRWYEYFGTTPETTLGRTTQHLHHPDHWPRVIAKYRQAVAEGRMWEDTFPFRGADGNYRWFLSRSFPIRDSEGKITLWFGTNTDITELRETENALQEANLQLADKARQLESLVQQRTAKLQETVGELEAFSYSIAHDMRSPLRSLQGFSDLLLEEYGDKFDAEGRRYLNRIASSAVRLDKLIRDVLDYSRVVRAELPLETVELEPLLREIMDTYPMLALDKVEILLEGPFPTVLGNQAMLTQIFSNLMGNAVKFVPPGVKPRLKLWAEAHPPRVRVFVQDNGIGIGREQHQKIFGIFQQVDQRYEGTGIGLAIVKKAVERIGGKVGLESELGKGSTFWVELKPA